MISVIVPVYNVEPYLRKCLDSILVQTYRDLEILTIDDGSTDGSGRICDEYAGKDDRIKVSHTENRGLSAARNLGLDNATGDWVGFVDSDDWIEPDMYEVLLRKAEETGADVVECGCYLEYPRGTVEINRPSISVSGVEAIQYLLREDISNAVWDKLWKRRCFDNIRFPEGRIFEEHATTYRVFGAISALCTISSIKYHYFYRPKSLSQIHSIKNLTDCWISNLERKEALWDQVNNDGKKQLLRLCAISIARTWAYLCDCTKSDREKNTDTIQKMSIFTKSFIPLLGFSGWSTSLRVGIFFPHFMNCTSFRIAWLINRVISKHH